MAEDEPTRTDEETSERARAMRERFRKRLEEDRPAVERMARQMVGLELEARREEPASDAGQLVDIAVAAVGRGAQRDGKERRHRGEAAREHRRQRRSHRAHHTELVDARGDTKVRVRKKGAPSFRQWLRDGADG